MKPEPSADSGGEATTRALIGGALRTQAIYVAAKLGLADHLALGARGVEDLAQRVHALPGTLRRLLRFLVVNGVFTEEEDGRFGLNRAAELLQTAHPRSLRQEAVRAGEEMWELSSRLLRAVRTGQTPHVALHGTPFFERIEVEEKSADFARGMNRSGAGLAEVVAGLECVRNARTVVDVGGGHGGVLHALLRAHPDLRGVLFDRAPMIAGALSVERCELVAGDFFAAVPAGADVYLLSWILHDWDDHDAARILRACRAAGGERATLVIAEALLPPRAQERDDAKAYALDLRMLLLTGGRERTADEYRTLLAGAGYEIAVPPVLTAARGASVFTARVTSG